MARTRPTNDIQRTHQRRRVRRCKALAVTAEPHPFTWAVIEREPKVTRRCLTRLHRTMEYEILHTGGFVRLCTERGRVYWLAQNSSEHTTPDWKLHFSILPRDVPRAWDILTHLFMSHGCDFGMKAVAGEALSSWPQCQRGRELTVYIFQHSHAYADGGPMMEVCSAGTEHRFWLGPEFQHRPEFWQEFVIQAEHSLAVAGIDNHGGIADGDLALGKYASLRNEAFVITGEERHGSTALPIFSYPPNDYGWNAAGHELPMRIPLHRRGLRVARRGFLFLYSLCQRRRRY